MTGIFVIPIMTASGPPSEEDGVLLPFEMWWRGLAESSSLLITEEGPRVRNKDFPVTQHMVPHPQTIPFFFFDQFVLHPHGRQLSLCALLTLPQKFYMSGCRWRTLGFF